MDRQAEQIIAGLAGQGYLISQQRRILINALCRLGEIHDVERFWMELRDTHGISWATVYSNLNLLTRAGWLSRQGRGVRNYSYRLVTSM